MAEAADERDGLEPTGVASGRVWLVIGAVFLLLFATLAIILVFALLRLRGDRPAQAKPFPFPALETSVAPRMTADRDHGPKPYRELPAPERPARLGTPDPRLLAAEQAVAARGAVAYDPVPTGERTMRVAAAVVVALAVCAPARAALTREQLGRVSVRPPLAAAEPMDLAFTAADTGRRTTLAQAAGGEPLVLVFADYACATLCGPALAVTGERLAETGLPPGRDGRLAVIGLQPDSPAAAARTFADARLPAAVRARAAVLIGDASAVRRATAAAGYGYVWDGASRQFAHPVAAFVLAPDGRLVRTLSEVALTGPALREALDDARAGRIGSLLQQVALVCHGALEAVGRFDGAIILGLRGAGLATLLALPAFVVWWSRRRRRAA